MSAEKQGGVKSEITSDGGLKLTIKREKVAEDTCKPVWVTEAQGDGLGKLVIKRKGHRFESVTRSPKSTAIHVESPAEQRPVLRLSLTSSSSSDGSRTTQVKSWSLCEVSSGVEDAGSASELSPARQLQPSPKDSGIDISSPPHDDTAVSVEPNPASGAWGINDCLAGDRSGIELEKTTAGREKLKTTIVRASSDVHSRSRALWTDSASGCSGSRQPKVQSTLRNRAEASALRSFSNTSQKLVNPLAKNHRVGRYQHMLPVSRIRSESNASRRSSLEESPTYNMVASRTSMQSRLPRVKTKLKLLSNNTYVPVFDHGTCSSDQHNVDRKSTCSHTEKSTVAAAKHRRSRFSCKSSATDGLENVKVKFSFSYDKNRIPKHRPSHDDVKMPKLPKLKLVVKSDAGVSVSRIEQRLEDTSVTAAIKHTEDSSPRHLRCKKRKSELTMTKGCEICASDALLCHRNGLDNSGLFCNQHDSDSSHRKRKSSEVQWAMDMELSEKKSKPHDCVDSSAGLSVTELPVSTSSQLSFEDDCVCNTDIPVLQLTDCEVSPEVHVCNKVVGPFSVQIDECLAGQENDSETQNTAHSAVLDEPELCTAGDPAKTTVPSAEVDYGGTGDVNRFTVGTNGEQTSSECCSIDDSDSVSNSMVQIADSEGSRMDWESEEKSVVADGSLGTTNDELVATVEHDVSICCSDDQVEARTDGILPPETGSTASADSEPTNDLYGALPETCNHTSAVFGEEDASVSTELSTDVCTDSIFTPLLASDVVGSGSVVENNTVNCASLADNNASGSTPSEGDSLFAKLNIGSGVEGSSCSTVCEQNSSTVIKKLCTPDLSKLDCDYGECQQVIMPEVVDMTAFTEKDFDLTPACSVSDNNVKLDDGCKPPVLDSDPAHPVDLPCHLKPLASPHCGIEHKDVPVANAACSNSFLAAFAQFLNCSSLPKNSSSSKTTHMDIDSELCKEIQCKSDDSQTSIRPRLPAKHRRRYTCSEKEIVPGHRRPRNVARRQSASAVERVSSTQENSASLGDVNSIDLCCSAEEADVLSTLCRQELQQVFSCHCQIVNLRHRVCELLETLLPELQFPSGFRRDSFSVERFVNDIIDTLSHNDTERQAKSWCSDPVVVLHRMPDRCLESLQQQVLRLLALLLPNTDLSVINTDSIDMFLELLTSVNHPLPGAFCVSRPDSSTCPDISRQSLDDRLQLQGDQLPQLSSTPADTNNECKQLLPLSPSGTESHTLAANSIFNIHSSPVKINTAGSGDKRSIRRQVKDCLMFLDRDLT